MVRCFGAMTLLTTTTCTISCRLLPLMTFDKTILFTIKEYRKVTGLNASQVFYCCFNFYDKILKKMEKVHFPSMEN